MTDTEFLERIKSLYEKDGGMIVRLAEKGGKVRTWILKNQEELKEEKTEMIPEKWKERIRKLYQKASLSGTAMDWDEDGGFLFLENAEKEDRIVICGAGYVGHALAKLSVFAGIRTIVLEDREYFAELAKKSGAHEVICLPFDEAVRSLNDEKNTAYVVMTRGHAYDQKCLMEIAKKESYYTGMMGSRTRAAMMREELEKAGIDREWTKKLHAPIGLKIGAQTPEEIAVSVMAEILQERSKAGCSMKTGYEVFRHALENMQEGERFVLSTILERRGSAPRKEGTHFIVSESGNCFGTIGGGKLEADIVRASQEMMKQGEDWRIEESDLNNRDAADEGLVCGGHVKVLMETGKNR